MLAALERIDFRLIRNADLPILRAWFEDPELARRLSYPTDEWFAYVTTTAIARCWIVETAKEPIAQLQVDHVHGEPAYLDLALRPDLRGQGLGQFALSAFLAGPGKAYPVLVGHIEPDNHASLHCCQNCGFVLGDKVDEDGMIRAEYWRG